MTAPWPPPRHSFVALSTEVRWFFTGPLPGGAAGWARTLPGASSAAPRVDEYVVLPGAEGLGIKVREGRLEVKSRTDRLAPLRRGSSELGRVEQWAKWSVPVQWPNGPIPAPWTTPGTPTGIVSPSPAPPPLEHRVRVEKTRTLAPMGQGFLEVSDLKLAGGPWWSLALEVWATGPMGDAALRKAAENLLDQLPGEVRGELSPDRSCGYPAFLDARVG